MAAVVGSWESLSALVSAMQNAVPNTFSKVEIAESGDYVGQLVAYDDDDNVFLRIASQTAIYIHYRDGVINTFPSAYWNVGKVAICANGMFVRASNGNMLCIAKDHRGKLAMTTPDGDGNRNNQYAYNCDTNAYTAFIYGSAQVIDQTNLCHMMLPKAGTDTNYLEHGYMAMQCNINNTSPWVCQIAGHTYISCERWYIMDE